MTPTISVLLPTVRPGQFKRSFDSIRDAASRVPYEVIVVADFGQEALGCNNILQHLRCRWMDQPRSGPISAINAAYLAAHGEYVFVFNDEAVLDAGALDRLYDEALGDPRQLYAPRHVPGYTFAYYGQPFAPFPFVRRDVLERLGGLFDIAYKAFYADPDLGLRAHAAGVPIRVIEDAVIRHDNMEDEAKASNVRQYMAADQATFRARWAHLGEFRDC